MVDHVTTLKRSQIMAAVHSQGNTSTEIRLKKLLEENNIDGWATNVKDIFGRPDFVFEKEKLIIFVDGCFWHGCTKHKSIPKSNVDFWEEKIHQNILRDKRIRSKLRRQGWYVLRVWEHDLKGDTEKVLTRITRKIIELS